MTDKQQAQAIIRSELLHSLAWLAIGLALGYLFGYPSLAIILVLLLVLVRYAFIIISLVNWLFIGSQPKVADKHLLAQIIKPILRTIAKHQQRRNKATIFARGFRELLQRLPDAIVLINKDETIEWLNDRAIEFLPLRRSDLGNQITALIRKPNFVEFLGNKDYLGSETINLTTDKNRFLTVQRVSYNENSDLLVFRDITRSYLSQQQLVSFIAHASHEINTPLTVIKGNTELAQSKLEQTHPANRFLTKVVEQSDSLASLTRNLLTIASIDQPQPSEMIWFKPSQLLKTIYERIKSEQPQRNIEIHTQDNLLININESHLAMLAHNLIENACKYSPDETTIKVNWQQYVKGTAILSVVDQGIGIAEQHIDRVTERFYRVPVEKDKDPKGTGLGLSIVQAIVNLYKGELLIESRKGQGSNFSCIFPEEYIKALS